MNSLKLTKRLIVKEDINFDTEGTGETVDIVHADGTTAKGHKVNASHVPLSLKARNETGAGNLDDAVKFLSQRIDKIITAAVLPDDLTVEFLSTDTPAQIQAKIDAVEKNLGGHTVTFQFPEEFSWSLLTPLEWSGFYNGAVTIQGGSGVSISDGKEFGAHFMLHDNQCRFTVKDIAFTHNRANTQFAIKAERCSSVEVIDCDFTGVADSTYAMMLRLSNGDFSGGSFTNEAKVFVDGTLGTGGAVSSGGRKLFDIFPSPVKDVQGAKRLDLDNTLTGCLNEDSDYHEFFQKAVELKTAGRIVTKTNAEFDADIAAYGQCGAFVINEDAGSIRLPKVKGFLQVGTPGTLHNAGLPNITGSFGRAVAEGNPYVGGAFLFGQNGTMDTDAGSVAKLGTLYFGADRSNPVYGGADTVQPQSQEMYFYMQVSPDSDSDGDSGPQINLTISDVLNILAKNGFQASGGVVSGAVTINGSLTVSSGATVSGGLVVDGEDAATKPFVAANYLPSSGAWTATVASGSQTDQLEMKVGSGAIVRRVVSTVDVAVNPPWGLVSGVIVYDAPAAGSSGAIIYDSSAGQWNSSYEGEDYSLSCTVDSSTGLITARLVTAAGGAGDNQFEFSASGSGMILASGYLTSEVIEGDSSSIVSSGTYSVNIVASGTVSSSVTVSSKEYSVYDALDNQSGGGTQSGAMIEGQPFSTTVGGYTVELTSNGGLSVYGSGASVTLSGGAITASAEDEDMGIAAAISFDSTGLLVSANDANLDNGEATLQVNGGVITANGSAITQVSSGIEETSLEIDTLEGGVKYVCQSALTALSIGSAAPGCNAAFFFTVASGAVVTLPGSLPFFGEYPNSSGASYCLAINGDMAVCAAAVSAGV